MLSYFMKIMLKLYKNNIDFMSSFLSHLSLKTCMIFLVKFMKLFVMLKYTIKRAIWHGHDTVFLRFRTFVILTWIVSKYLSKIAIFEHNVWNKYPKSTLFMHIFSYVKIFIRNLRYVIFTFVLVRSETKKITKILLFYKVTRFF